jgi:hypothetical protein
MYAYIYKYIYIYTHSLLLLNSHKQFMYDEKLNNFYIKQ